MTRQNKYDWDLFSVFLLGYWPILPCSIIQHELFHTPALLRAIVVLGQLVEVHQLLQRADDLAKAAPSGRVGPIRQVDAADHTLPLALPPRALFPLTPAWGAAWAGSTVGTAPRIALWTDHAAQAGGCEARGWAAGVYLAYIECLMCAQSCTGSSDDGGNPSGMMNCNVPCHAQPTRHAAAVACTSRWRQDWAGCRARWHACHRSKRRAATSGLSRSK